MKLSVRITRRARADIGSLHEYISEEASSFRADKVVNGIFDGRRDACALIEQRMWKG